VVPAPTPPSVKTPGAGSGSPGAGSGAGSIAVYPSNVAVLYRGNQPFHAVVIPPGLVFGEGDPLPASWTIQEGQALVRRAPRHNAAAIERSLDSNPQGHNRADPPERKTQMHPEDLMNADMLSEILLLVSGSVIFVTLLLILAAALTQTAALT
jgi:hypothetical protein